MRISDWSSDVCSSDLAGMGAKNHCVIMPAAEREAALNQLLGAAFGAAGQRCMAPSVAVFVGEGERLGPAAGGRAKKSNVNAGHDRDADSGQVVTPGGRQSREGLDQTSGLEVAAFGSKG